MHMKRVKVNFFESYLVTVKRRYLLFSMIFFLFAIITFAAAPSITINSPSNGRNFLAGDNISLNFTVSDADSDLINVEVYAGNKSILNYSDALIYQQKGVSPGTTIVLNLTSLPFELDRDLLLLYRFDNRSEIGENATYVVDYSKFGNNGTINGGIQLNISGGRFGGAGYFNATAVNYVSIPYVSSLDVQTFGNWSIFAWVKFEAVGSAQQNIISQEGTTGKGWLSVYNGRLASAYNTTAPEYLSTSSLVAGNWTFVGMVVNSTGITGYLNGVRDLSTNLLGTPVTSGGNLRLGLTKSGTNPLNGSLDELMILNRTLTDAEVANLYNRTAGARLANGNYYWNVNITDATGQNASSPNQFNVYSNLCDYALNGSTVITSVTGSSALTGIILNEDADYYIAYGTSAGSYSSNTTILQNKSSGTSLEVSLTGLSEGTRYYYRPYARRNGTTETYCALQAERNFTTKKSAGSTFSFAFITDTHWQVVRYLTYDASKVSSFANITSLIRAAELDFVVDTGDGAGTGSVNNEIISQDEANIYWKRFRNDIFSSITFPYYFALGNHESELDFDGEVGLINHTSSTMNWSTTARLSYLPQPTNSTYVYGGNNETRDKNATGDYFTDYGKPMENYYAFDWGDATFIILDTYRYSSRVEGVQDSSQWTLGKEQFEWLNRTLATSNKKWKFLFAHHIVGGNNSIWSSSYVYGDGGGNYSYSGNESYGQKAINPLMERYNAQFFVYGHVHLFAHDWANWSSYNRTGYVNYIAGGSTSQVTAACTTSGALYRPLLYDNEVCQNGYTKYDVSPQNVTFSYINTTGSVIYNYTLSNTAPRISTNYTNNTAIYDNLTFQYLDNEYDNAKNCSIFVDDVQKYTGFDLMNGTTVTNSLTSLSVGDAEEFTWYVNCSDGALSNRTTLFTSIANITVVAEAATGNTVTPSSGSGAPSYTASRQNLEEGYDVNLAKNFKVNFYLDDSKTEKHTLVVNSVSKDSVTITVSSEPVTFTLKVGDVKKLDLNNNGFYELEVSLKEIKGYFAKVSLKSTNEKIVKEEQVAGTGEETNSATEKPAPEENRKEIDWFVVGGCVLVIVVSAICLILVLRHRKKKRLRGY